MPLVKATLAQQIKAAFDAQSNTEVNPATAREQMASDIADAVDAYIKAGTVTVDPTSHIGAMT